MNRDGAMKALSLLSQPVAVAGLLSALACGDESEKDNGKRDSATAQAILLKALHSATHLDNAAADLVLGMLLKR